MKIATKLILFFAGVVALFALLAGILLRQMQTVSDGYDALLNKPVRQMEMARVIQVNFKKQVQEWKDVLLRGRKPEDLTKYTKQFHDQEWQVRQGARNLADTIDDAQARELLLQFLAAHRAMGEKYEAAYDVFISKGFDSHAADDLVRGQDRDATDLFDKVVQRLNSGVEISIAAQKSVVQTTRNLALALIGSLLLTLGFIGFLTVRSILRRLAKLQAVADRLAVADLEGLTIDISGSDEIGNFGESMKGVHAAIEELSKMVSTAAG